MKKQTELTIRSSAAEYLTYVATVGEQQDSIEMRYEDENIWLTQKMMATLYNVDVRTINEHIKKIYADSELEQIATIRKFRIVQSEGLRQVARNINHYNLQMIIAVGFKVNSERAVQFRKWVNRIADDREILTGAGKITAAIAKVKAETEFEKYRVVQDRLFMSDFDKYLLELEEKTEK